MAKPRLLWAFPEMMSEVAGLAETLDSFAQVDVCKLDQQELRKHVADYDILVPLLEHEINADLIDAGVHLRLIGTPSTGTDHIDIVHAQQRGIPVVSIKDDRAFLDTVQATAELAWLLILACSRNFRPALDRVLTQEWYDPSLRGHALMGRTLGIVGYGRLGTMVGRFAKSFRMRVLATDPQSISDPGIEQVSFDALLQQADIITLHLHLTDATRGMMGREQLCRMKSGAVLVNTSRGALVDEDALIEVLQEGKLAAVGLDVVQGERDADLHQRPLLQYAREHDNIIITPHIGGRTFESQAKAVLYFAKKLRDTWQTPSAQ